MKIILAVMIVLISGQVFAVGNESGGGGPGIFCPASVSTQPPVQLLDLYEGRHADPALVIPESNSPYEIQIQNVLQRLSFDLVLKNEFQSVLKIIRKSAKFLPSGVGINVPSDIGADAPVLVPTGCSLAAIGYYSADNVLTISSDAFNAMTETHKAAFWAHETIYKIIRDNRDEHDTRPITSKSTRLFVAYLFSKNPEWQKLYYLSNECWRNHLYPYDQLGEYWEPTYGRPYRKGIESYYQRPDLKLKVNDLMEFTVSLKPYSSGRQRNPPKGSIQCWDLNSQTTKDLIVKEEHPSNYNVPTVQYYLEIPADCNILQFNGIATYGVALSSQYQFSINIGRTGYFHPIFDRERTVYDLVFFSGSQRVDEGFIVRIPIYQ